MKKNFKTHFMKKNIKTRFKKKYLDSFCEKILRCVLWEQIFGKNIHESFMNWFDLMALKIIFFILHNIKRLIHYKYYYLI